MLMETMSGRESVYSGGRISLDADDSRDGITVGTDATPLQRKLHSRESVQIHDYDAAAEKFNYNSSKEAFSKSYFTITSANTDSISKFRSVHLQPDNANFYVEISRIVSGGLYRKELIPLIKYVDAVRITNPMMHERSLQFQSILSQQFVDKDFTYLFMDIGGLDPAREAKIFNDGLACGNMPLDCLGDPNTGVYLSKCVDTCTVPPLMPFVPHRFLIFKVLMGKMKFVNISDFSNSQKVQLDPSFNSQAIRPIKRTDHQHYIFYNNLIYIYDMVSTRAANEYPRSIYPYGAVTFYINDFYSGLTQMRLPYLPKNEIGNYRLSFKINSLAYDCTAYTIHDHRPRLSELSIKGIVVEKVVSMADLGRTYAIKKFLAGEAGTFMNCAYLKFWSNATSPAAEFVLRHTVISSQNPNFRRIVKNLQLENQAMVFGVPWIPMFSRNEEPSNQDFGFCVPNSPMSFMLGVPYFAADVLHVFILSKVVMSMVTHPIKTIIREEILMAMLPSGRIGRSDKISDNDIRTALSCAKFPQITDTVPKAVEEIPKFEEAIVAPEEPMEVDLDEDNSPPHLLPREVRVSEMTRISIEKTPPKDGKLFVNPTVNTLIIVNPSDLREEAIEPSLLGRMLSLAFSRCDKKIDSNMTFIYHSSMKAENLAQVVKSGENLQGYTDVEDKYKDTGLLDYCEPHICDRGRLSHRASLVCLLTLKRKKNFDNAVIVTTLQINQSDVDTFKTHKIFITDPSAFVRLLETGNNCFLL